MKSARKDWLFCLSSDDYEYYEKKIHDIINVIYIVNHLYGCFVKLGKL